jgi:hypothetical protein
MAGSDEEDAYSGVFGTFPYAFRRSESRLFRSYVALGGLLAGLVSVLFVLALVIAVATTLGTAGGTFTFTRAFVIAVGLAVVFPLVAPVLFVARHHRRVGADARYDAAMAASGYLFVASLYVGLVASIPAEQQAPTSGPLAPVVDALYGLDPLFGLVPPVLAALLVFVVHRRLR